MRRFSVGEVVTWIPDLLLRSESHGDYRIVAAMPDRDGDHMYRIKSPLEEYERVVKQDLLVIAWLFARRGASSGVAPQLNHTADSASRIGGPHSITSSARAMSVGGTVRPSIRAIWALMTSSNLVDCSTGKSAGLVPLRMRPVTTPS